MSLVKSPDLTAAHLRHADRDVGADDVAHAGGLGTHGDLVLKRRLLVLLDLLAQLHPLRDEFIRILLGLRTSILDRVRVPVQPRAYLLLRGDLLLDRVDLLAEPVALKVHCRAC
jgi:hypothetical protein